VESTGIDSSCKEVESSWHSIRNSIPLDSTGILTFSPPNLLKYSTGFHWIQVESTGIQLELSGGHERPQINQDTLVIALDDLEIAWVSLDFFYFFRVI